MEGASVETARRELKENFLMHAIVVALVCGVFLSVALARFASADARAFQEVAAVRSASHLYPR
jgi:hypothetical protein